MHNFLRYDPRMDTPAKRLKDARAKAGFKTAKAGAERMALPYPTYAAHENGSRGILPEEAARYAKAFKTRPEWILYGEVGPEPIAGTEAPQPPLAPIVKSISDSLDGLTEAEQRMIAETVARHRALLRPDEKQS